MVRSNAMNANTALNTIAIEAAGMFSSNMHIYIIGSSITESLDSCDLYTLMYGFIGEVADHDAILIQLSPNGFNRCQMEGSLL